MHFLWTNCDGIGGGNNLYSHILLRFSEKRFIRSQVCRTAPNEDALESTDSGASNGGRNFETESLRADLVRFELAR